MHHLEMLKVDLKAIDYSDVLFRNFSHVPGYKKSEVTRSRHAKCQQTNKNKQTSPTNKLTHQIPCNGGGGGGGGRKEWQLLKELIYLCFAMIEVSPLAYDWRKHELACLVSLSPNRGLVTQLIHHNDLYLPCLPYP